MKEIYEHNITLDKDALYAFVSYQSESFEDVVKEESWLKSMDEQI
jgi:hypothetical protein